MVNTTPATSRGQPRNRIIRSPPDPASARSVPAPPAAAPHVPAAAGRRRLPPARRRPAAPVAAGRASASRSPKRSSPRPCCRVPKNSPTPRSRASSSASAKPSVSPRERPQPFARLVAGRLGEQVALPRHRPATDPAAQLVQLRQAEALRVLDHHQRRVRHIHADLHHRRADQQVELARGGSAASPSAFVVLVHAGRAAGRRGNRGTAPPAIPRASASPPSRPASPIPPPADRRRIPAGPAAAPCAAGRKRRSRWPACSQRVCTGCRPGGSWRMIDTSRSPKTVRATVRGIGVAVMTR